MDTIAKIIGVGKCIPERVVTSKELEADLKFKQLGVREGTIQMLNGVGERHFASDEQQSSDLAAEASLQALEMAGISAEDLDIVMFCSITQDFIEPSTSNVVQHKIGAINAKGFDIKNACNAFITGLEIANSYIKSGEARIVLVAAGEIMSRYIKRNYNNGSEINETNSTLGFGDGGGAIILKAMPKNADAEEGLITRFKTIPQYWNEGVIWGGGTMYMGDPERFTMKNVSPEYVQKNTISAIMFYFESMKKTGVEKDEVDLFITTQMSKYMVLKCADTLKVPHEKVVTQMTHLGNTAAASIPIGLCRAIESGTLSLESGQRVVMLGAANGLTLGYVTTTL